MTQHSVDHIPLPYRTEFGTVGPCWLTTCITFSVYLSR